LAVSGLELLDNQKSILIDKIKNVIIEMIHYAEDLPKVNYSDFISKKKDFMSTEIEKIKNRQNNVSITYP
jgi:hypothetical protein